MEQILKQWAAESGFALTADMADKLIRYAMRIHTENELYNLTGLKTAEDVLKTLIMKSIEPVVSFNVPRGTTFMDIGTGSGIPGVVLLICFPHMLGTLVDANGKKTEFIKKTAEELGLSNVTVINARAEDVGQEDTLRNKFDWVFTRAFGPIYYSFEFALPVLKNNGKLYIYSNLEMEMLSPGMLAHIKVLGGAAVGKGGHSVYGINEEGLLVVKERKTPPMYPRRFPIVKRESQKVPETIE